MLANSALATVAVCVFSFVVLPAGAWVVKTILAHHTALLHHDQVLDGHKRAIDELHSSQQAQDHEISGVKQLLTDTRELIIEKFAKVFTKLEIRD